MNTCIRSLLELPRLHFACTQEIQLNKIICFKAIHKINSVVNYSLTFNIMFNTKFPGLGGTFLSKEINSIIFRNSKAIQFWQRKASS